MVYHSSGTGVQHAIQNACVPVAVGISFVILAQTSIHSGQQIQSAFSYLRNTDALSQSILYFGTFTQLPGTPPSDAGLHVMLLTRHSDFLIGCVYRDKWSFY